MFKVSEINTVTCVGAGVIGQSWAVNFAMKGLTVRLYDIAEDPLKLALTGIHNSLGYLKTQKVLTDEDISAIEGRISTTTSIADALAGAQYIQESGPEKYPIKRSILAQIDEFASPDTIYATSTSGLLISEIAKESKYPERCVGAHPYNPPHLIPLVELSKGEKTAEEAIQTAFDFYRSIGKEPIILNKESLGFVANRLQIALAREAADLLVKGVCSVEAIDKAVSFGPGLRWAIMGPNMLIHIAGGDAGLRHSHGHMVESAQMWLADMATWSTYPSEWEDMAVSGVEAELKNRTVQEGRTIQDAIAYRDEKLIEILKIMGKL